jgi:hypothetical protein
MNTNQEKTVYGFFTKSLISVFLLTLFTQIFLFNNAISKNSLSKVNTCSVVEKIDNTLLDSESLIISFVDIPLIPEFENIQCLNTIYGASINEGVVFIALAQNKVIYSYALVVLSLINFIFYFFRKERLSLFLFFLVTLNLYIFLVAENSIAETFILAAIFLVPLITDLEIIEKINMNFVLLGVLFLSFFLQQVYLSKEVLGWEVSTYLSMGQDINRGNLPYESQYENKGVFLFYIYSIIDFLSNGDYRIVKFLQDIPLLVLTILMFSTLKQKGKKENIIAALLVYTSILSIEYYGASGFTELYALLPIALAIYLLEKKQDTNFLFLGILFSLATLTNHGTAIFFIAATFYIYLKYKNQLARFFIGFSIPHLFFLLIYFINDLLRVYLIANIQIPLGYTSRPLVDRVSGFSSGFTGAFRGLYNYNIFLAAAALFITGFIVYLALNSFRKDSSPNALSSLPYFFVGGLIHLFIIGQAPGRYNFLIYLFCLYIINLQENIVTKFLLPLVVIASLSIFQSSYEKSSENIQNFETIEEKYLLQEIAKDLQLNYDVDTNSKVLALDHHLILYYLDVPNLSYVNHPTLMFLNEVNLFDNPENTTKEEIFNELMSKEPDIILCNEELYSFCENINNYKKIEYPIGDNAFIPIFIKD